MVEEHENHGHSVAAWTMVGLVMLGSLAISLGVAFGSHALDIIGAIICAIGVVAGKALSKAGFGAPALHAPGDVNHDEVSLQAQTGVH
ncbi:MAG: HGxxPAAW family protein [Allobranchiibius sp.]